MQKKPLDGLKRKLVAELSSQLEDSRIPLYLAVAVLLIALNSWGLVGNGMTSIEIDPPSSEAICSLFYTGRIALVEAGSIVGGTSKIIYSMVKN